MPKLVSLERTPGQPKEFKAVFIKHDGQRKTVRFGTSSNYVLNPSKTIQDRTAYIKRHRVNENWRDPTTPGALSRWILWGHSRSWRQNLSTFKKKFRLGK